MLNSYRARLLKNGEPGKGPVLYWMSREQRMNDNWALIFASSCAKMYQKPLVVVFSMMPSFLNATARHYDFMISGLKELEKSLHALNISFIVLLGSADNTIPDFIIETDAAILTTDFDPLKIKRNWKNTILKKVSIPVFEIDAHNIVPCIVASDKEEFGAYTIRPKISKLLNKYLFDFPEIQENPVCFDNSRVDWNSVYATLNKNDKVYPVEWMKPGYNSGMQMMNDFIDNKIEFYQSDKNDPNKDASSNLSPYLHFGQISAQRIVIETLKRVPDCESKQEFLEQIIIRKELADNFCYYNTEYDSFKGFKNWALQTLNNHRKDERSHIYTLEEFEFATTSDNLWNTAQKEMVIKGKMHGYMRMYWAKKILEWTESPEKALEVTVYLNDKYSLDGRDPNGYTGCAWSIGGIHDRAWGERPVFGKIRFMNESGCRRKFDVHKYISSFNQITLITG